MDSAEACYLLATKLKVEIVRGTLYCNFFSAQWEHNTRV